MPFVQSVVKTFFKKKELHTHLNPDEVVAMGAAVEADILAGNRTDLLLLDVTPLSLGIETVGGLMDVVIGRNTTVPSRNTRHYSTSVDGQTNLRISIYQGEREIVKENRKLGEFILENIPAMPAGIPKIEISFILDADGILQVQACEKRSNIEQHIRIQPQYGLTDEEVEQRLLDGIKNAEADKISRETAEAKVEGQNVLNACRKICRDSAGFFSTDELKETENLMIKLELAINGNDKDAIYQLADRLNEYTRPVTEKIMDNAISTALKGKHV
jgi:molecular chaperone HscA